MEPARARPQRPPPPVVSPSAPAEPMNAACHFIQLHHRAFTEINQALGFDEQGSGEQALSCYKAGVQLIEQALALNITVPESSDLSSKCEKMTATLNYAKTRVRELSPSTANHGVALSSFRQTGLPTYEEATSPVAEDTSGSMPYNADVLLEISNAQVFFITAEGYVSTPSYPSPLRICKFATQFVPGAPDHFLQIGNFTLPLVEDLTPSLQTSPGSYVFPDITSTAEGAAVGILLSDDTPPDHVEAFESMLASLSAMRPSYGAPEDDVSSSMQPSATASQDLQPYEESSLSPPRLSTKIGHGITVAAGWVNWGLVTGAEKFGGLLAVGGEKVRGRLQASAVEKDLDESYRKGLATARTASTKVVAVSSFVVKMLGEATVQLGRKAAPFITSQAKKILPEKVTKPLADKDASGRSKCDDIIEVAGAGVKGFGVIYIGLENAAKALGRAIAQETSTTVTHRYGQQYGEATNNAMYTVGNTLLSAHNITQLGPKAIAKRAVKDTAKAVVSGPNTSNQTGAASGTSNGDIHTLEITEIPSDEKLSHPKK